MVACKHCLGVNQNHIKLINFVIFSAKLSAMSTEQLFHTDQTPTEVMRAILDKGPVAWSELHPDDRGPLGLGKLRLVGVYDDNFDGTHMLRTRIPGGRITARQLRAIAGVVNDYSVRKPGEDAPERFAEITTRQNFQIHWIRFENLGDIWKRFSEVGLSSLEACGNSMRNITSCPVDGIDPSSHFEVGPVIERLNAFALENEKLSAFLPRKFKVAVTACDTDCVVARVNCIAFTPAEKSGRFGFNIHLGGGLSDYPRLATQAEMFVTPDQTVHVVRAALGVFADFGDYQNSSINRFRALVHELGEQKVEEEIRRRLPFDAPSSGNDLSTWGSEDHVGVHADSNGSHYVGLCVPLGRMSGDELEELSGLSERYGDSSLRLTLRQNIILTGVRNIDRLLDEPLLARLRPNPDPFERGVIACTSAPFCKFAILSMKPYGSKLIDHLRANVPKDGWDRLRGLKIHMSGCKASCAQISLAHIGFRATMGKDEKSVFDAFDIALGGDPGERRLAKWRRGELPAEAAFADVTRMLTSVARGEKDLADLVSEEGSWSGGSEPMTATVTS